MTRAYDEVLEFLRRVRKFTWRCRACIRWRWVVSHQQQKHARLSACAIRVQVLTALQGLRSLAVNRCPRIGDKGLLIVQCLSHLTSLNCYGCVKARPLC